MTSESLIKKLHLGLRNFSVFGIIVIGLLSAGLHITWTLFERRQSTERLTNALAHVLQNAIQERDLVSIKRSLQAFSLANPGAVFCVKIEPNLLIEQPTCEKAKFVSFPLTMTSGTFSVSVILSPWSWMSLGGVLFILASFILGISISVFLRKFSAQISADLALLQDFENNGRLHFSELADAKLKLLKGLTLEREAVRMRTSAELGQLATQVAHDIRSPLAALKTIEPELSKLSEDHRLMVRSAISRIQDIANQLLINHKNKNAFSVVTGSGAKRSESQIILISNLLDIIISEKRLQYRSKIYLDIELQLNQSSYGLFALIPPVEFRRIVSNLIDNSVDALADRGKIRLRLINQENTIAIQIEDNGRGIPKEIMNRLGERGATFGKKDGSGLGLHHAFTTIHAMNGKIDIQSKVGGGTTVSIFLPKADTPNWFVSKILLTPDTEVVILDDDSSIHQIWNGRFESTISQKHRTIYNLSTAKDFKKWFRDHLVNDSRRLYLMDFELLDSEITGLDLIREFGISKESILVTSRFEEPAIRKECELLGVKLIPKNLAGLVEIS